MNDEQRKTFLKGGYYYFDTPKGDLRLLLLNTIVYNVDREVRNDPYGQFAWIKQMAADARERKKKLGIVLHIPPGVAYWGDLRQGWNDSYIRQFDEVVAELDVKFTIAAHCHYDMLLPVLGNGISGEFSLSAPAVSPIHSNNPGFRVMKHRKGQIVDIQQYYADIMLNPGELKWELAYEFGKEYRVKDLSKKSLTKVVEKVLSSSKEMWKYREKIWAMAADHGSFYYCILRATTEADVKKCMRPLDKVWIEHDLLLGGNFL
jgi:sphingomyelin phosphodiesterase acid-like 3